MKPVDLKSNRSITSCVKDPGTQNVETGLDDWIVTYTDALEDNIAEATGSRPVRDFLMAVGTKEATFADAHLVMIRFNKTTYHFYGLIEDFRQHLRLQQLQHPSKENTHSAFATGGSNGTSSATYRGQQTPPRPCICGDTHWLADCPYLVVDKRTPGWNASQTKQKKVDDALRNEQTKAWVERTLQRRKDIENKSSSASGGASTSGGASSTPTPTSTESSQTSTTTYTNANLGSFCAKSSFSSFSTSTYPLSKSWILDNGSDIHVCNSTMFSRFTRTRLAGPNDKLTAGTPSIPIECFGTIDITIRTPTGPQQMTLPYEELTKSITQATPQEIYAYQQRIGSTNFAAVITRPDVAHESSKLSEYLTNPSAHHLECANRVLSYLAHTRNLSIEYNAQTINPRRIFLASSDASFANDPDTRQSSQGYAFMLFNGMIDWKASKQKTVTTSSTEAELLAISATGKETIWWTRFFESIDFHPGHETYIRCDNMQTIRAFTSDTPRFTTKLRHVDIHRHWLRQEVQSKRVSIEWTSTTAILADGQSKGANYQRFDVTPGRSNIKFLSSISDKLVFATVMQLKFGRIFSVISAKIVAMEKR